MGHVDVLLAGGESQDADPVGDKLDTRETGKLAVQRGLEQGLFNG